MKVTFSSNVTFINKTETSLFLEYPFDACGQKDIRHTIISCINYKYTFPHNDEQFLFYLPFFLFSFMAMISFLCTGTCITQTLNLLLFFKIYK